jgi:hypothetical protein
VTWRSQGISHEKKETEKHIYSFTCKARVATKAATPDELTTEEIIETQASPLRGLPTECFDNYLLADDEDWLFFVETALCENPQAAVSLARLLCTLKESIDSGPEGAKRTSFTLSDGIRIAYNYTEARPEPPNVGWNTGVRRLQTETSHCE